MRHFAKSAVLVSVIMLLMVMLLGACDNGDDEDIDTPALPTASPTATTEPTDEPVEDIVIIIGNLSDLTGPASQVLKVLNDAVDDTVRYFNEQNLIPGIEVEVVTYDGQYDPSKDIPGYEWLKEKGADLIICPPASGVTLAAFANRDEIPLFITSGNLEDLEPGGYAFSYGETTEWSAYTTLKWVAENDWDYETNGPAKIGVAGWSDGFTDKFQIAMKQYVDAHPDQYEWVGGHLVPMSTFTWGPEVDALKDCDYVVPPGIMFSFVKEYRAAGHTAKFIGGAPQAAFMGMIDDAALWDEIDGMLFFNVTRWWNEEGTIIDLTKELLHKNHPDSAERMMRSGNGYLAVANMVIVLELIKNAVETVGAENFSSQALYDAAGSYSLTVDGVERFSYNETKRGVTNYLGVYEARAADKNLFRVEPEWYPVVTGP